VAVERDEIEGLAAEYILGTLDAAERRAAEARIAADPAFRELVADWERHLQPLADGVPPVAPSAGHFDRVLAAIDAAPTSAPADNVVALRRSVRRWRVTSAVAGLAAAALLAVVVVQRPAPQGTEFVATLTAAGDKPAFVVTVNVADSTLTIRRVVEDAPPDKSYELWAVEPNAQPKSLGVVQRASFTRPLPYDAKDLVLAVSLEPKGGSPTGVATGPVVFSGALVEAR